MKTILAPIQALFTTMFEGIHNFVAGTGVLDTGAEYVISVFILTLLVRLVLLPINVKQLKSQAKMQEIQPKMKQIQTKYKNNPEKMNAEVANLYKENKVNPVSGCLPLIIQMPILFALYYVFTGLTGLEGVSFLWLKDLSGKDIYYILPILSGVTTYLSSYLMSKGSGTKDAGGMNMGTMNLVMAGMMTVMALNFPSMLVLYWIIGNLIQLVQTYILVIMPNKKKKKEA